MVIWRDNLVIRTTISYELPLTRNFIGQICEFSHIMYRYNLADLLISCYKQSFCYAIVKHIRKIKGHNNFCSVPRGQTFFKKKKKNKETTNSYIYIGYIRTVCIFTVLCLASHSRITSSFSN